ncbi:MAG: YggS family pyridoxal phosphate-dependent enzyme [Kiritimatiellae bacterium]|nr:YggS family pyridoxal phosphate-dependent enzyme [Kiritimatiellia bacterium]
MKSLNEILEGINANIAAACGRAGRDPSEVEIVAVTKTHGPEVVREAWEAGLRIVGENKVQEAAWKQPQSVNGPDWHLIGHLQKNKVRPALELFSTFHSVDSAALIERIQRVAEELGARPNILLEVNMSGERSKDGMRPGDVPAAVERALACHNLTLEGFMTMAPFVPADKVEETRPVFAGLRELRDAMETEFGASFPRLSMGMTNDYRVAVEEGATWIRLGTVLFGERPKAKPMRPVDAGDSGESGEGEGAFDRVMD